MATAFVLMPFDDDFTVLYTGFIRPVLEECSFVVERADDIENNRNILRDIVSGIHNSDLIVAELTGNNPNVLYELGLAHALRKPVIHLTQAIDDVPFDLRSYRMFEYSRDFSKIDEAKQKLASNAKAFLEGRSQFGNPVTDFLGEGAHQERVARTQAGSVPEIARNPEALGDPLQLGIGKAMDGEEERGFLDHLVDVNEGYARAGEVSSEVALSLGTLTVDIQKATEEITRVTARPNSSTASAAQSICRRLAPKFATFNADVSRANGVYAEVLDNTEDSLEFLVSFQLVATSGNMPPESAEAIGTLRGLRQTILKARDSTLEFASTVAELPGMERRLNRETARTTTEVRVMANHLDRIYASISRAINASGIAE